jgi:hypothetical protein
VALGLAVAVAAIAVGIASVSDGDPVAADALYAHARSLHGDDYGGALYLDAARELSRVKPWHTGYASARERLRAIQAGRRAFLEPTERP